MPTVNAPTSQVVQQYFGLQWVSKNSDIIMPEVRRQAYEKYGKGIGARDIYFANKNVVDVPNQTITVGLKDSPLAAIKLGSAISTVAAGADITAVLDSTMYDTNDNGPLRVGDDIYIPKEYLATGTTEARAYRVASVSGTGAAAQYTCKPYAKDLGFYSVASRVTTAVPSGTVLMIGANSFAAGTAQPAGMTDSWDSISFKPRILKETVDYEGGQVAQSFYDYTGYNANKGVLNSGVLAAEFRLDVQESRYFFLGEANDNSTMTQTSESGVANLVVSGAGMWPHAGKYGQALSYSGDFVLDNLYDAGILQQSQGITSGTSVFMVGPELARDVETSALDFIKTYSGGSDLLSNAKNELGIDVKAFMLDGRTYVIWRPDELADPTGMGININGTYTYAMASSGLIVPNMPVTVPMNGQPNVTIPNVQIGYVNKNGENRRRVMQVNPGVNGLGYGDQANSSYDGLHVYMLSHMTPIFALPNQWIKVYKA